MQRRFNFPSIVLFLALFLLQNRLGMAQSKVTSKVFFAKLSPQTMNLVAEFYDEKVVFKDPLGEIRGVPALESYYRKLYNGAEMVKFEIDRDLFSGNEEVLFWNMTIKSKNLNGGKEFTVPGNSHFVFSAASQKCIYHRDYFDMGAFVYERVPVLKNIIGFVKGKMKDKE